MRVCCNCVFMCVCMTTNEHAFWRKKTCGMIVWSSETGAFIFWASDNKI